MLVFRGGGEAKFQGDGIAPAALDKRPLRGAPAWNDGVGCRARLLHSGQNVLGEA